MKVRYIGATDECVECQKCGKADLKATVILGILDADGNIEEVTYYGSTCAARALAERGHSVKGGGRAILQSARYATERLRQDAQEARQRLTKYGLPQERTELTKREWLPIRFAFVENHYQGREMPRYGAHDFHGPEYWQSVLMVCVERWWATLADAQLVGV
jgi:hypothetical protein